jgi:hypothetical protein
MKKQILDISLMILMAFSMNACDFLKDEETEQEQAVDFTNT